MSFSLPDLPYAYDALAPYMSRETLEYHHDKHHLAYVNNGNNLLKGTEWEGKSLEEIVKGSFGKNAGLFNNAGQHYNHIHFWKWMKPNGGGDKIPGELEKKIVADLGSVAKMKEDFIQAGVTPVRLRLVLARGQGRQDRHHEDAERREPAGARRQADPRLRRVGAFLLHRLSQPPARLPQGLRRSSGELGLRRRDVRGGGEVSRAALILPAIIACGRGGIVRPHCFWVARRLRDSPIMSAMLQTCGPRLRPIAVAVLGALRSSRSLTFRDYGLGWDDYTHSQYGELLLDYYALRLHRPARPLLRQSLHYGGGFDMVAALLAKVLPFDLFETRRLVGAARRPRRTVRRLADRRAGSAARSRGWSRSCCSPPARCSTATCSSIRRTRPSRSRWRFSCSALVRAFENIRGRRSRPVRWSGSASASRSARASWARSA